MWFAKVRNQMGVNRQIFAEAESNWSYMRGEAVPVKRSATSVVMSVVTLTSRQGASGTRT